MTILRATAGLQADDALDLDLRAAPAHPHLVGQRQQLIEPVVGQPQHLQHLVAAQSLAALQHLLPGHHQDVNVVVGFARRSRCRLSHQVLPCIFVGG